MIYQQITRTILFEQPKQKQNLNKGFNSWYKSMKAAFGKKEVLFISCWESMISISKKHSKQKHFKFVVKWIMTKRDIKEKKMDKGR